MSSSPWARGGASSPMIFPPPTPIFTPPPPLSGGNSTRPRRRWLLAAAGLVAIVGLSAGVASAVTYMATQGDRGALPLTAPPPAAPPPTPQFSATETAAAKKNLCQIFDLSVRGQSGQGGLRVEGQLNVPAVLRSLNSAVTVQNALTPAIPREIASAAQNYVNITLGQTTAAMGNSLTSEVNRLTDSRNDAQNALLDACGLPR